jgi:outer membrane protein OmpA-like peptidoglycan-associated protein/tetratricopeptide (TPR) repeat protein
LLELAKKAMVSTTKSAICMIRTFFLIVLATVLFSLQAVKAQKSDSRASDGKLYKKSTKYYNQGNYNKSRELLQILVQRHPNDCKYNYKLGLNFYFTHFQKELATPFFEKALNACKKDTVGEIFYYLGDLYQFNGELEKAIQAYNSMKRFVKNNAAGVNLMNELNFRIAQCNQGKAFAVSVDKKVRIENLGKNVNSRFSDHTPVLNSDGNVLLFTSTRRQMASELNDFHEENINENIFLSKSVDGNFTGAEKISAPNVFAGIIPNPTDNNALIGFSADYNKVLTYNDQNIYYTELTSGVWKGPNLFPNPINVKNALQAHACMSADGKTIYFASDRPGGFGGLDIYRAEMKSDGSWNEPVNLGPQINSKKDENSPFITPDGKKIYFSSKGHNSIGGYDIFYSEGENNKWGIAKNIGRPINSPSDDINYFPVGDEDFAYFSSSRSDGLGGLDIYKVSYVYPEFKDCSIQASLKPELNPSAPNYLFIESPETVVAGTKASFSGTHSQFKDQDIRDYYWDFGDSVEAKPEKGSEVQHIFKAPGAYQVKLEVHAMHNKKLTTENYCITKTITVLSEDETIKVIAQKLKDAKDLANYGANAPADYVYYDFSKPNFDSSSKPVVDKTLEILKNNPNVKVVVVGHTDSRGPSFYNKVLSRERAKAVRNYLITKGIDPARIELEGKGEEELLNHCADGVKCSEEEHKQNRRAEIQIR